MKKRYFWIGFVTAVCVTSLVHDALGPELALGLWVDWRITVPLALAGLMATLAASME